MRILVIRFSSLGDVVLSSAALHALSEAHPDADIILATKSDYTPLFTPFRGNVRVIPLSEGMGISSYLTSLGSNQFDLVVDLHSSLRSRSLTTRLKCGELRRVDKHTKLRWQMVWSKEGLDQPLSVVRSYLKAAGASDSSIRPKLYLTDRENELVREKISARPRRLGIGWGAKHPTKSVPTELWKRLILALQKETPLHLQIFGLPSDDAQISEFVRFGLHGVGGLTVDTSIGLSLRDVMVELAACHSFVSSDSGLMHLADALGVPTFGLFGPTHPALGFAPAGKHSCAFHAGTWCSPCHRHGSAPCFRDRLYCFEEMDVATIARAISSALNPEQTVESGR